jgi:hypothetical protein
MPALLNYDPDMRDSADYSSDLANGESNINAFSARRLSLLSQDPEGYAKACSALANLLLDKPMYDHVKAQIIIVNPHLTPMSDSEFMHVIVKNVQNSKYARRWHEFENMEEIARAVEDGLKKTEWRF